jgi:transcription termination/antitermination protein NusG
MERNPDDLRPGGEGTDPSPDAPLDAPGEGAPTAPPDEVTEQPDQPSGDDEVAVEPALAPDDPDVDAGQAPAGEESPDASAPAGPEPAELEPDAAGEPELVEPQLEPQPESVELQAEPAEPEPVELQAEPAEPEPEPETAAGVVSLDGEGAADALAPVPEEVAAPTSFDPMRGPGEWYVVHTYAGYENKVKANLESRIQSMQMQDKIFDVHIPMEDVMEIKAGKKQVVQKKVFPGYLLVKMVYDNDSWYVVRNTPGVTGFVSSGTGTKPTPLSRREVEKILQVKKEEVKPTFRLEFEEGDMVRIISGPFADFNGHISEINVDQSKLKVLVNIFDRETPVELGFDQVAKV